MDPLQQRLLAQILQQPQHKTLDLKECQTTMEHLQQQVPNAGTMADNFWFALLAMQRNGTTYSNFTQNLNVPAVPSSPACNEQSIFSKFNSIINANYLPAVAPSTMSLLSIPSVEEAYFDVASFLVADELQKRADSTKQTWQNLMQHHEIQSPRLTTQHKLHQHVPPVSPFMKRRISESLQQQHQQQQTMIKRAKVVLIEQKDPESIPCCSSSPFLSNICYMLNSPVFLIEVNHPC